MAFKPMGVAMPIQHQRRTIQRERRDSERVPFMQAYPYELMKGVGTQLSVGDGYAIDRSVGGMLLLLPEKVNQRQLVEIQAPPEARKDHGTKLVEVCWTRSISVNNRVNMHLVGARLLFELPLSETTGTRPF